MKKVGIITFHWAPNYGAVLQAYALQKHLERFDIFVEDINYLPLRNILTLRFFDLYLRRFENIKKAKVMRKFRNKYLQLSPKIYFNNKGLFESQNKYDYVVAGSDQIWNESFMMTAEKNVTLSYYLNFMLDDNKRISYAASFGTNEITANIEKYGIPELKRFKAVSVREENAVAMLKSYGIDAYFVCDPTLLIPVENYEYIIQNKKDNGTVNIFNYLLRGGRESSDLTEKYIIQEACKDMSHLDKKILSVEDWLWKIKTCDLVLTDSFHCTVFAILFHKTFIAINDKNCSMNARIQTLCKRLGLEHRILESYDQNRINGLLKTTDINWEEVDRKIKEWSKESTDFLLNALEIKEKP